MNGGREARATDNRATRCSIRPLRSLLPTRLISFRMGSFANI
jgi:hypothetical protein